EYKVITCGKFNLVGFIPWVICPRCKWIRTNETGSRIFKLIDGKLSVENIIKEISKIYNVPEDLIDEDVISFLNNCYKKDIISSCERDSVQSKFKKKVADNLLKTVYINVTERCNLRCPYCYLDSSNNEIHELEVETWKKTIKEINQMHVEDIFFAGGEPLFRNDLFDILEDANLENIKTKGLITNGTNITSKNIDDICDNFNVVQVALDGVNKETHEILRGKGTYNKVIKAINLLKVALDESKIDQVLISMTIVNENKKEIRDMVRFAHSKKFNLSFFNVLPVGQAKNPTKLNWLNADQYMQVIIEAYDEFSKIVAENIPTGKKTNFYIKPSNIKYASIYSSEPICNCGLGIKELSISSDGTVYPCRGLNVPDLSLGNIRDSGLIDLYQKSLERFSSISVDRIPECGACSIRYFCGGGCRIYGYINGDLYGKDPNCNLYKSSIYSAMLCKDRNIDELIDTTKIMYENKID
ncbi:MAG: PqqD family peptide modification chaperone, partial [Candidatus Methanoperedens sp.]|nr:PqqD family peptide modification chaperone [Candidatus Methanoperedens sp.]